MWVTLVQEGRTWIINGLINKQTKEETILNSMWVTSFYYFLSTGNYYYCSLFRQFLLLFCAYWKKLLENLFHLRDQKLKWFCILAFSKSKSQDDKWLCVNISGGFWANLGAFKFEFRPPADWDNH